LRQRVGAINAPTADSFAAEVLCKSGNGRRDFSRDVPRSENQRERESHLSINRTPRAIRCRLEAPVGRSLDCKEEEKKEKGGGGHLSSRAMIARGEKVKEFHDADRYRSRRPCTRKMHILLVSRLSLPRCFRAKAAYALVFPRLLFFFISSFLVLFLLPALFPGARDDFPTSDKIRAPECGRDRYTAPRLLCGVIEVESECKIFMSHTCERDRGYIHAYEYNSIYYAYIVDHVYVSTK